LCGGHVARRPYAPNFASTGTLFTDGLSIYHSLQVTLEKRFSRGFTVLANYTFSKSIDLNSTTSEAIQGPTNPRNWRLDRGLSAFDMPQRLVTSYVWQIPVPRLSNVLARGLLHGWQTNGILSLQSGLPFSVMSGRDNSFTGLNRDRADLIGNPYLATDRPRAQLVNQYFNPAAFTFNAIGTPGTAGRDILRGPGFANLDASLFKSFQIREHHQIQFRAEAFNLLNRPNFNSPGATVGTPGIGKILSTYDPRITQLALKYLF
jgi:hypothetical protein